MADATLSTKISRRTILAGTAVLPVATIAPPTAANPADARLAWLAAEYRRALTALCDWIAEVEERRGLFAYEREPCRARYGALCARADELVAEIAGTRPDSVAGLAVKLRLAVYPVDMDNTLFDCDARLMLPALDDADRMAAAAFGAGQRG